MEKIQYEEFYKTYYEKVYKYILKKTANFHLSEDLTMDVFTCCYQHFEEYNPQKASYGTWVFAVANNRLKNYYRDRKDFAELNEQLSVSDDMGETVIRAQHIMFLRDKLADALETLNETQQAIVILRYFKNKNATEIAQQFGMTPTNVRVTLKRSIKKLKEYFEINKINY